MKRWLLAGIFFGVLWLFVRGVELTANAVVGQFLLGLTVGLAVAYVFRRLYEEEIGVGRTVRAVPYAILYALVFLKEVLVANLDVTYRVLAPSMPIEPEVILIPLRVESDVGVTTIANSITITPGTVTLDHDPDENALYVHTIDGRDPEAIVRPIRAWESYALRIFDEPRSPDDPAPEISVYPPGTEEPPEPKTEGVRRPDYEDHEAQARYRGEDDGR